MDKLLAAFTSFANEFGLAWALLLAVGVAYWMEIQDRKKNTVPKDMYIAQQERCNTILENQVASAGAMNQLTELVRFVLQSGKGR